jgi:hypothetical protein
MLRDIVSSECGNSKNIKKAFGQMHVKNINFDRVIQLIHVSHL